MAVALRKEPTAMTDYAGSRAALRARIVGSITARVTAGHTQRQAAQLVLGELLEDGRAAEVLELLGSGVLLQLWEKWRPMGSRVSPPPGRPRQDPAIVNERERGRRRVDVEVLQDKRSLLECLYKVDGEWITLGDLVPAQCRVLAAAYARLEATTRRHARAFGLLAERLPNQVATVREQLSEDDVRGIFREAAAR